MRWLFAAVALAACRSPAPAPAPDAGDQTIRVATFNVRRFFDTVCQSGRCESDDYEALPSTAAFDARARQLASAIHGLGADVVALQEVETQACLDALLAHVGDEMPYGVLGEIGSAASVDVAVLSKTPIERVVGHRMTSPLVLADGSTALFSRELLEVHVNDGDLIVLAAHFRSKSNDDPARRLAEAQVARRVVSDVAANAPQSVVVLAGDLNDVPGSPPLDALVANGGLVRLADDLPVAAQATYSFGGRGQAIDHLLVRVVAASVRACRSPRASGATAAAGDGVAAITRRSARSSCSDGECTPHAAECKSLGARVIVTRLRAAG